MVAHGGFSGVVYEVSGLVNTLDLTTDPKDIRLVEDCDQVRSTIFLLPPAAAGRPPILPADRIDTMHCRRDSFVLSVLLQHVFNGRPLKQPFPAHGRSLREWLKIHFLDRGQARTPAA